MSFIVLFLEGGSSPAGTKAVDTQSEPISTVSTESFTQTLKINSRLSKDVSTQTIYPEVEHRFGSSELHKDTNSQGLPPTIINSQPSLVENEQQTTASDISQLRNGDPTNCGANTLDLHEDSFFLEVVHPLGCSEAHKCLSIDTKKGIICLVHSFGQIWIPLRCLLSFIGMTFAELSTVLEEHGLELSKLSFFHPGQPMFEQVLKLRHHRDDTPEICIAMVTKEQAVTCML